MCPKLFILKEFYFLILEYHIINIHSSELLNTKTKESRINDFFFFKVLHNNLIYIYIYMDNLHFIPNNIHTIFLKN